MNTDSDEAEHEYCLERNRLDYAYGVLVFAINTFVERGVITSEQAEKMDLFTRGDMAKIIYETQQRELLR